MINKQAEWPQVWMWNYWPLLWSMFITPCNYRWKLLTIFGQSQFVFSTSKLLIDMRLLDAMKMYFVPPTIDSRPYWVKSPLEKVLNICWLGILLISSHIERNKYRKVFPPKVLTVCIGPQSDQKKNSIYILWKYWICLMSIKVYINMIKWLRHTITIPSTTYNL